MHELTGSDSDSNAELSLKLRRREAQLRKQAKIMGNLQQESLNLQNQVKALSTLKKTVMTGTVL